MSNKLILVVDDNDINRMLPSVLLKPYGIHVLECSNGWEALELIKIQRVDCMLIDISMPSFTGLDLISHILKNSKYSEIKLIAYTADAAMQDEDQFLQLGFHQVLIKPVSAKDLLSAIGVAQMRAS